MNDNQINDNFMNNNISSDIVGYSFWEIYHIIKKNIKILILSITIFFSIAMYYSFSAIPIYKSSGSIMISKDQNSMSMLNMEFGSERNFIDNEIEILNSRSTSERVIRKLLNEGYIDSLYLFNKGMLHANSTDLNNRNIDDLYIQNYAKKLKSLTNIENNRNIDLIIISNISKDPFEAAFLTNTYIDVFKNRDLEWATGEMNHLKLFLIDQLDRKEIQLNSIESRLKKFQEDEKIFNLDSNSKNILDMLTQFETEYNTALAAINILDEKDKFINNQLTNDEIEFGENVSNMINIRLFTLKEEMMNLESELISTNIKYDNSHSAVVGIQRKLTILKNKIQKETKNLFLNQKRPSDPILFRQTLIDTLINLEFTRSDLESKANAYKSLVHEYENKLALLPEKMLEFTKLERIRAIHVGTYQFMSQKLEESKIGEASKISKIRVIDKAIPNSIPISPNNKKNLLVGLFIGIISGLGIIACKELLDTTVKSIEQLERRGLAILAIIPAIGSKTRKNRNKKYVKDPYNVEKLQRRLITHEDPKSPVSESYRLLRTGLMYTDLSKGKLGNVVLVSSAGPGEGKTTTIANLAITYANLGMKVLLVDSDLRKPVIHNVFNVEKTPGLTSYISNNSTFNDIINKTDIENLDVVSSGHIPPNPSELIESKKMNDFIATAKEKYNYILFDSPPLIAVTDAYIILKNVDQFILVVRAGVTEIGALQRVLSTISQTNSSVTGVVMNAMREEHAYGSGYYYNYYRYYEEENDK